MPDSLTAFPLDLSTVATFEKQNFWKREKKNKFE